MKTLRLVIITMLGISVITVAGVIIVLHSGVVKQGNEIRYLDSKNLSGKASLPSLLTSLYGDVQPSLEAANLKAPGVIAKEARYLPLGMEKKMVMTPTHQEEAPSRLVAVIYAPISVRLDDKSTFEDVLDHQGIITYSYRQNPGFDPVKWTKEYALQVPGAKEITVNDKPGIAIYGNPEKGIKSQVLFHDGEMQYSVISVAYQPDELLKIAESMQ